MVKRIKPVSRIIKIEAEINRIVSEAFPPRREPFGLIENWVPYADISEESSGITVKVELPGVLKKDISIRLYNNRMEVTGIKREDLPKTGKKYLRLEREYGRFRRMIYLPSAVMPEKASASLEKGILTVSIKKYRQKTSQKEFLVEIQKDRKGNRRQ